ncbi:hypothetical protein DFH06DRAFT_1327491 [Mycena polygramma]|nr:hypothetical protein DFH06DRAFT_1327491 [Mycena polygramma]
MNAARNKTSDEIKKQLWLGVIKAKQSKTLILASDDLPSGVELARHCQGASGKKQADRVLYIASKARITKKRYQAWDDPETEPESEDLGSDIDTLASEDIIKTPPRRPIARRIKQEVIESDMKSAARIRTRLSTGAIVRKDTIVPGSSNDDLKPTLPEAGPSESQDVVEISDDEDFPPVDQLSRRT